MSNDSTVQNSSEALETQARIAATNAEVEQLRAEVVDLRRQASARTGHRARRWAVALLIVLGCILAVVANPAVWVRNVLLDTDDWVATVEPLTRNEVVTNVLSSYVVDSLFELVDAQQEIRQALPEQIGFLSGPLTRVAQDLAIDAVSEIVRSDAFNSAWVTVNRIGHQAVVAVLRFEGDLLALQDGQLVVDLSDVFDTVQGALGLEAVDLFGGDDWGRFVLFGSRQLAVLQQVVAVLDSLRLWLPLLTLAIFGLAVLISLWRRRTLLWIGIGLAVAMVVTLIFLAVAQRLVLASIPDVIVRSVTDEIWDIVLRGLFIQTIWVLIIGVLVAAGAVLAGPQPWAVRIRTGVRERVRDWQRRLSRT